jgi:hypothetical protein
MTKTQIIERLKAAGVTGWDKKNLAELEAMASENGVSLAETTTDAVEDPEAVPAESETTTDAVEDPEAVPAESSEPTEVGAPAEDAPRFITPSMACSRKFFGADPEA